MFTLPTRHGLRPRTSGCAPHEQLDQNPTVEAHQAFKLRAFDLPFVERRRSLVSVPDAEALCLQHGHAGPCREAFMAGTEFAHVHPAHDGSLHLMLPSPCVPELRQKGWGEPHPLVEMGYLPDNAVMVFGPRDAAEIDTVLHILRTSYDFASGKLTNVPDLSI